MKLEDLSPTERKKLLNQLKKEEAEKAKEIKEKRQSYKDKADNIVPKLFTQLQKLSTQLATVKTNIYNSLEGLIDLKQEVYERESDQQTHSFSSLDGSQTITIGYRQNDGWDDTVNVGMEKVRDVVKDMAKDKNSKALVETVLRLLSKDAKGNLKASRVLQLQKMAEDLNNPSFTDAINIIKEAYKPVRTKQFVSVYYKDERGDKVELPLSITDAPLIKEETTT